MGRWMKLPGSTDTKPSRGARSRMRQETWTSLSGLSKEQSISGDADSFVLAAELTQPEHHQSLPQPNKVGTKGVRRSRNPCCRTETSGTAPASWARPTAALGKKEQALSPWQSCNRAFTKLQASKCGCNLRVCVGCLLPHTAWAGPSEQTLQVALKQKMLLSPGAAAAPSAGIHINKHPQERERALPRVSAARGSLAPGNMCIPLTSDKI